MKQFLTTILALFIVMPSLARHDIFDFLGLTSSHNISEKNFADTIHITYNNGMVMVPVTIRDSTYQFMYDTGSSTCILPESLAYLFEKHLPGQKLKAFDNKSTKRMKSGVIAQMTIGRLHLNGMKGSLSDANTSYRCLLGADVFYENGIIAKLDIKKGILVLTDIPEFFSNETGHDIPLRWGYAYPNVRFSLSYGCSGNALFDTGFNSFMFISRKYYDKSVNCSTGQLFRQQVVWKDYGSIVTGVNGAEAPDEKINMKIKEVRIGDVIFQNMPVSTSKEYTGIGCRILEYGSMIINPMTKSLVYQPYDNTDTVTVRESVSDIALNTSDGSVKVEMLNPNSIYYQQGVRKGDYIIEVNGHPVNNYADYVMAMRSRAKGAPYTQKFRTPDGRIIVVLHQPRKRKP